MAYGKVASAAATQGEVMVPSNAVDGSLDPNVENCFHHDMVPGDAWWRVDLGAQYVIYNMTVYNRVDGKQIYWGQEGGMGEVVN